MPRACSTIARSTRSPRSTRAREPLEYLEEVAGAIADGALALEGVTHARVAVRKPHVMLDGPLAYAEIVVERARG